MRLARVRFTVRRLMVAVAAVAAIITAILGAVERQERLKRIWLGYELEREDLIDNLDMYLLLTAAKGESSEEKLQAARPIAEFDRYLTQMAEKYHRASARPWLPVYSDPPPPPRPSREYVETIISRYNRRPGEPERPKPPPKSYESRVQEIINRYSKPSIPTHAL
jgi:hypothetical protein